MNMATAKPKVMIIYGTRPEAIKVAPLVRALRRRDDISTTLLVTGQHREMLDQVHGLFGLKPDYDLDLFCPGQSLNALSARALERLDPVLADVKPDAVVVQGDTTTAFAGAWAAFLRRIPVIHLEAGLRSGDLDSPFPEEANRRLISQVASLHLAPTPGARDQLVGEGIGPASVVVTGNTVIDALFQVIQSDSPFESPLLAELEMSRRPIILMTVHRRESWGAPIESVAKAIRTIALEYPNLAVVIPLHPNPVVRQAVLPLVQGLANVLPMEPLPYGDFARLMSISHLIVTDSGGVQEEAPSLGKPVLVVRENTERPEAVDAGTVRLIGTQADRIVAEMRRLLMDPAAYTAMAQAVNPYGDGEAAERSVRAIAHLLALGDRAPDYIPAK